MKQRRNAGWYATFTLLVVLAFVSVDYLTGRDALGATGRFLWSIIVFAADGFLRVVGGVLGWLARGVGLRRLSRISKLIAGVGFGYAGSVILSGGSVQRARGWRAKFRAAAAAARERWHVLPLPLKLLIVATHIASQLYLHSLLIVFPIAFLVPIVRRLWIRIADLMFGTWYWKAFGRMHHTIAARLRSFPLVRGIVGATRLARIRYLCAWRLWKHDPRYRDPKTNRPRVSLREPIRLWWRGQLDGYVGHPLLTGSEGRDGP